MCPPDLVTVVWSLFDGVGVVPSAADAEKYAVQCADSLKAADAQRVAKKRHKVTEKDNHPPSRKARAAACGTRKPISADMSADVSMISDDEDLDKLSNEPFSVAPPPPLDIHSEDSRASVKDAPEKPVARVRKADISHVSPPADIPAEVRHEMLSLSQAAEWRLAHVNRGRKAADSLVVNGGADR